MRNAAVLAPLRGKTEAWPAEDDEFTGLFREYHPQLFRYVTHHFGTRDADEITQEAMARALRSLDRRRSHAETWAWLVRVARNVATDLARSRRICEATDDAAVLCLDLPEETTLPEPAVLLDERRRVVRSALNVLTPGQRRVLFLYEVDELSCPTIAGLLGSNEETVRKTLQRARRAFAKAIRTVGGGVCGSVTVLVRGAWLRRRVRGLSALSSGTALCAFAGTVAITVGVHPAPPEVATPLGTTVATSVTHRDQIDVARDARRAVAGRTATRTAHAKPGTITYRDPGTTIHIPKTPLSPGQRTPVLHLHYDIPVVGPLDYTDTMWTDPDGGIICHSGAPGVSCV